MRRRRDPVALRDIGLTTLLVTESLLLFVAFPLAAMGFHFPVLAGTALVVPLIAALIVVSPSPGARMLAAAAVAVGITGAALRIDDPSVLTAWFGHAAVILGLLATSLVIGRAVFGAGRITHHRIQGAIVLYLNIAAMFTAAYRLILELDPNAYAALPAHRSELATLNLLLYFSFTTLTSTGFGDILPVQPLARSLANLEAVVGQLYLTVLLARLVTLHIATRRDTSP